MTVAASRSAPSSTTWSRVRPRRSQSAATPVAGQKKASPVPGRTESRPSTMATTYVVR